MGSLVQPCIGPNGTGVTNANATSGNQFNTVTTTGTGTTQTWDNGQTIHGNSTSLLYTIAAVASTCFDNWSTLPNTPTASAYDRVYFYATANPTATTRILIFAGSGSVRGSLAFNTGGTLSTLNAAGTTIATTTATVPLSAWCRIEFEISGISGSTGLVAARIFSGGNLEGLTPDSGGSLSTAGASIGGTIDTARIGFNNSTTETSQLTFRYSDIAYSDVASPGPLISLTPVAIAAWPGRTWLRAYHHPQNLGPPNQHFVNILPATATAAGAQSAQTGKQITGTVTATGSQSVQAGKLLTGASAAAGTVTRQVSRALSGAATAAGTLARQVGKLLPGTTTAGGSQSVRAGKQITTTATATGTVTRGITRTLTATATAAGTVLRRIGRILTGAASAAGALIFPPPPPHVYRAQVTITPAGPLAAQVTYARIVPSAAVAITPAGAGVATVTVAAATEANVAITPAGAGAATVTISEPSSA